MNSYERQPEKRLSQPISELGESSTTSFESLHDEVRDEVRDDSECKNCPSEPQILREIARDSHFVALSV